MKIMSIWTELDQVFQNVPGDMTLTLVFELMSSDLEKVLYDSSNIVSDSQAKAYAFMLLDALAFLHSHFVLHRDVKPANLLISEKGVLKLADFGYARYVAEPNVQLSYECCTLWYRPPELLFGANQYSTGIDTWGAGCILAELHLRRPIFRGESDTDQLARIFAVLGSPNSKTWPGIERLRKFVVYTDSRSETLHKLLNDNPITSLITNLLNINPNRRISAADAVNHSFFHGTPKPELRPLFHP